MTKVDIFSGFLGAGKTTLIKKLLDEAYKGEKVVLIENEFGEIGIDGGFLKDAGVEITEMNSGCICCSLVGDFSEALKKVVAEFSPDRILIEPSGVGKLSDVIKAVGDINSDELLLNSFTAVVDAKKCKMYMKNFGEFYNDQVESAGCIVLSHTTGLDDAKISNCVELIREKNESATIVTTPWEDLDGKKILEAMEGGKTLEAELKKLEEEEICPECGGHHHHHEHDEHCGCGHHDHEHHHEHCECEHHDHEHHHEHGEHCGCEHHDHEHHHEHDEHCSCGCHDHEHGHHHADEVFSSWGIETTAKFSEEEIKNALEQLENERDFGMVLRAKGIVAEKSGKWIHFDYVPGEADVRFGAPEVIGRLCVIGSKLNKEAVEQFFSTKD
ncbi:MAG: cobalamin biosynthesis protein CobW [Ruminococcaceae bacterium]|nr:cobalamin biosynthesis protein CobW [Oscillospiraceae bacterium]